MIKGAQRKRLRVRYLCGRNPFISIPFLAAKMHRFPSESNPLYVPEHPQNIRCAYNGQTQLACHDIPARRRESKLRRGFPNKEQAKSARAAGRVRQDLEVLG